MAVLGTAESGPGPFISYIYHRGFETSFIKSMTFFLHFFLYGPPSTHWLIASLSLIIKLTAWVPDCSLTSWNWIPTFLPSESGFCWGSHCQPGHNSAGFIVIIENLSCLLQYSNTLQECAVVHDLTTSAASSHLNEALLWLMTQLPSRIFRNGPQTGSTSPVTRPSE